MSNLIEVYIQRLRRKIDDGRPVKLIRHAAAPANPQRGPTIAMLETVRARLTLWYVSLLAAILVVVLAMVYVLLARALYVRIDDGLRAVVKIAVTSLANDLAEGQTVDDAREAPRRSWRRGSNSWPSTTGADDCWARPAARTTS